MVTLTPVLYQRSGLLRCSFANRYWVSAESLYMKDKSLVLITSLWIDTRINLISILIHHHPKSKMVQLHYMHSLSKILRMQLKKLLLAVFFPINLKP